MLFKQGKTDWGYLSIFVILVVIISGGILNNLYLHQIEKLPPQTLIEDETSCNKDEDCVITSYTYDCCGAPCGGAIVNRRAFEKRKQWTTENCKQGNLAKCPLLNCRYVEERSACENNKCIKKAN